MVQLKYFGDDRDFFKYDLIAGPFQTIRTYASTCLSQC